MTGMMKKTNGKRIAAHAAMVAVLAFCGIFLPGCGCNGGKENAQVPVVQTNRIADTAYIETLKTHRREQDKAAQARNETVFAMQKRVEEVRALLPSNYTDEQVKAELEKDPAWKELVAQERERTKAVLDELAKARETVRKRIAREQADAQAVREGRARAQE